jgi:hypothetical protein
VLTPENANAFVSALLRDIDPTANVLECTLAPGGFGYRVQLEIHGDTTKMARFPAGLLVEAEAGNAVAARAARLTLQALLIQVETRRVQELSRHTLYQQPPGATCLPPEIPRPRLDGGAGPVSP